MESNSHREKQSIQNAFLIAATGAIAGSFVTYFLMPLATAMNPISNLVQSAIESYHERNELESIGFFDVRQNGSTPIFVSGWCGWQDGVNRSIRVLAGRSRDDLKIMASTNGISQVTVSFVVPRKWFYEVKAVRADKDDPAFTDSCYAYRLVL